MTRSLVLAFIGYPIDSNSPSQSNALLLLDDGDAAQMRTIAILNVPIANGSSQHLFGTCTVSRPTKMRNVVSYSDLFLFGKVSFSFSFLASIRIHLVGIDGHRVDCRRHTRR